MIAIDEIQKLTPSDAAAGLGQSFGTSVAVDGNWIAVGAPGDDFFVDGSGAVYLYRREGTHWVEADKVKGLGVDHEGAGHSVAMDRDWLVTGAPDFSGFPSQAVGVGRAYVFRRDDRGTPEDRSDDTWNPAAVLNPPPSHLCCNFGVSVDIDGPVIVVGTNPGEFNIGRAYVFRWDGTEWNFDTMLVGSDTTLGDSFGRSVATNGSHIIVGARRDNDLGPITGAAYAFKLKSTKWVEQPRLTPFDGGIGGQFGISIAMNDHIAIVGRIGGAYVYQWALEGWVGQTKLTPGDPANEFGRTVSVATDIAVVGAPFDNDRGSHTGSAFVFRQTAKEWIQDKKLLASDGSPGSSLGESVATDGTHAVVASVSGAYIYRTCEGCGTLNEFGKFQSCFGTHASQEEVLCDRFDFTDDAQIDLADYSQLHAVLIGP